MDEFERYVPPAAERGTERTSAGKSEDLAAIHGVSVKVTAVLGAADLPIGNLLRMGRGAVIELDRKVDEPVDIMVNGRLVARGELVVVEGNRLGVTMTEILKADR